MNSQLQEFYRQAIQSTNSDEYLDMPNKQVQRLILTKYAELIVRECARYINERTLDWDADLRWVFNDGSGFMDVDVDDLLNKHFGVESE